MAVGPLSTAVLFIDLPAAISRFCSSQQPRIIIVARFSFWVIKLILLFHAWRISEAIKAIPLLWVCLLVSASLTRLIFCSSLDPFLEVLKKYVI
ncbi:hypothetical protein SDJN03_22417, partial [Cucurbita argyrosperma subsp. sororia]